MSGKRRILMLTNAEYGQAGVFLATSHALLGLDPASVEIHFASFKSIRPAVEETSAVALRQQQQQQQSASSTASPIKFHEIRGKSLIEAAFRDPEIPAWRLWSVTPGFWTMPGLMSVLAQIVMPYNGPDLVGVCEEVRRVIKEVKPDLTVVDNLFNAGLTMVLEMGVKYVVLSPNTVKEYAGHLQPRSAMLWKYPCVGTGYPYPVPWYLIPLNIFYSLLLTYYIYFNKRVYDATRYLAKKTGVRLFRTADFSANPPSDLKMLLAMSPELDFPVEFIPDHIIPCGPIVKAVLPVSEVDPELNTWLARGPTVLVNLGTLRITSEAEAAEMARAISFLLAGWRESGREDRLQVLWKLKQSHDGKTLFNVHEKGCLLESILGSYFEKDVVRIVDWMKADPYAVLQTGHVVCSVNHGGANSFCEGISAGVPQVIVPAWADTYDFAYRAEYLGIGKWGSRTSAPQYRAAELGAALRQVVIGEDAKKMQMRAKELAKERLRRGEGREVAARYMLKLLDPSDE